MNKYKTMGDVTPIDQLSFSDYAFQVPNVSKNIRNFSRPAYISQMDGPMYNDPQPQNNSYYYAPQQGANQYPQQGPNQYPQQGMNQYSYQQNQYPMNPYYPPQTQYQYNPPIPKEETMCSKMEKHIRACKKCMKKYGQKKVNTYVMIIGALLLFIMFLLTKLVDKF